MTDSDITLPPDVQAAIEESNAKVSARLDRFALYVSGCRDEAVKHRLSSGIEDVWLQCEEDYLGIDDLNRHEWVGARWAAWVKGAGLDQPIREDLQADRDPNRATVFPRIAARYVDAGAAKIAEILIPVDGSTFSMEPTPVPELAKALEDKSQIVKDGQPQVRPPDPEKGEQEPQPLTVADLAEQQRKIAEDACQEAEDKINDWLTEGKHAQVLRKAIFDGARLGSMIVKGPVPTSRRSKAVTKAPDGSITLEMREKIAPVTAWVNPWNFYPADDCGEDATSGSYCLERDSISKRTLQGLKRQPGYKRMAWAIDKVLKEGPKRGSVTDNGPLKESDKTTMFDIWYFYGAIPADILKLTNPNLYSQQDKNCETVDAIVTMVNDTPIKVGLNPLQSGRFPYKVANWRRRAGHWAGIGVTEQARPATLIITGATRALVNNAGKSAGSIIVMDDEVIVPADGSRRITPDKLYHKAPDATMEDVRKAFATFQIPNTTPQLLSVIEYGMRLAEECTSIPLISQGQSGDTTPDTFSGQQLQDNNANQLLRDVGFGIAEGITEALVNDFYEWLLLDPDVPATAKGDMQVSVNGSLALIEKAIQDQMMAQMGAMVSNPAFGIDPKRWISEFLRSKRLNPALFQYTEEEQAKIDSQPPPEAPQVTAAKIRAQAMVQTAESRDGLIAEKTRVDTDRDREYNELMAAREAATFETESKRMEQQYKLADLKYRQAILDYANRKDIALDQAKAELAKTAMTLQLQERLATGKGGKAEEVAEPIVEPAGRAPEGEAFQK